jgi:energy-coupling factor transport system substrate-specific component
MGADVTALAPARPARTTAAILRPALVYLLVAIVGTAAFLYPFWFPAESLPNTAHSGDAPLVAGVVGALALTALALELRRGTMTGMTVAVLGVLAATAGLLRLVALPLGGNGIYFVVILVGVAFGPRFGLLLGMSAMAVSAVITGGIGPWLPFQMLALGAMGATAGLLGHVTVRTPPRVEVAVVAAFGWCWGFLYGAVMNLWFWPFQRDGGQLSWIPGSSVADTLHHYWSFYVATSYPWDAASAFANVVLIVVTGGALLATLRRISHRLDPVVEFTG